MEVFRFIAHRPPEPSRTPPVNLADARSEFQAALGRAIQDERPLDSVRDRAAEYLRTPDFVANPQEVKVPLQALGEALEARKVDDPDALDRAVRDVLGVEAAEMLAADAYRTARRRLGDSLIALTILGRERATPYPQLARELRLCGLIERAARRDERLRMAGAIGRALNATIALPEQVFPLPPVVHPEAVRRERLERRRREAKAAEEQRQRQLDRLRELRGALDELEALPANAFRSAPSAREVRYVERSTEGSSRTAPGARGVPPPEPAPPPWTLSEAAVAGLSESTRRELERLRLRPDATPLPQVLNRIERGLAEISRDLAPVPTRTAVRRVGARFFADRKVEPPAGAGRYLPEPGDDEHPRRRRAARRKEEKADD